MTDDHEQHEQHRPPKAPEDDRDRPPGPDPGGRRRGKGKGRGGPRKGEGRGPARGYRWKDAEPGNTLSLRHGGRSERVTGPIAARIDESLRSAEGWLSGTPLIDSARVALSSTLARIAAVESWLQGQQGGDIAPDGSIRAAGRYLTSLHYLALREREHLVTLARGHLGVADHAQRLRAMSEFIEAGRRRAAILSGQVPNDDVPDTTDATTTDTEGD